MRQFVLTCELCGPEHRLETPRQYAAVIVFHAMVHHGVTPHDVMAAQRYVAPHGDDWPAAARWRLPGPVDWIFEWPRSDLTL